MDLEYLYVQVNDSNIVIKQFDNDEIICKYDMNKDIRDINRDICDIDRNICDINKTIIPSSQKGNMPKIPDFSITRACVLEQCINPENSIFAIRILNCCYFYQFCRSKGIIKFIKGYNFANIEDVYICIDRTMMVVSTKLGKINYYNLFGDIEPIITIDLSRTFLCYDLDKFKPCGNIIVYILSKDELLCFRRASNGKKDVHKMLVCTKSGEIIFCKYTDQNYPKFYDISNKYYCTRHSYHIVLYSKFNHEQCLEIDEESYKFRFLNSGKFSKIAKLKLQEDKFAVYECFRYDPLSAANNHIGLCLDTLYKTSKMYWHGGKFLIPTAENISKFQYTLFELMKLPRDLFNIVFQYLRREILFDFGSNLSFLKL